MTKYKRSIKGGSFRPEQVSTKGEARLTEYANRLAGALREERDAVISNRDRISKSMGEASKIESDQLERDRRIEQQNTQNKIDAAQQQNQQAMKQYEAEAAASEKIYGTLASLSSTASTKLQEIEVSKLHEQWNQDYADVIILGDDAPAVKQVKALIAESTAKQVEAVAALQDSKNAGAPEIEISEAGERIRELSYGAKLATYRQLGEQYHTFLKDAFLDDTFEYKDSQGNTFTGSQAARNRERSGIVAAESMQRYLTLNGLVGTNPALLQTSGLLDTMLGQNQQMNKTAETGQKEDIDAKADLAFNHTLGAVHNPKSETYDLPAAVRYIESQWPDLVLRKGTLGALDYITDLAKVVDENGDPVYPIDALEKAMLTVDGQPAITFGQRRGRMASILRAHREAKEADFSAQDRGNKRAAKELYDKMYREALQKGLLSDPDKAADFYATTEQLLRSNTDTGQIVPSQLHSDREKATRQSAAEDKTRFEMVQNLARAGTLTQSHVNNINNPEIRAAAQALVNKQNKELKFGSNYQEQLKALGADARKLTGSSPIGAAGTAATELEQAMRKQFAAWYKDGLKKYQDPARALEFAVTEQDKAVAAAQSGSDDESPYYSEPGPNNRQVYENIDKAQAKLYTDSQNNIERIENTVEAEGSWHGALRKNPYLIMPKEKLQNLSQTFYNGGDFIGLWTREMRGTLERLRGSGATNLNMVKLINGSIQVHNERNPNDTIEEISSPELDEINNQDPQTQKLFTDLATQMSRNRGNAQINRTLNQNTRPGFNRGDVYNQTNRQSYTFSSNNPNVSSVTFDRNQPGFDVFFENKQIPALLHGVVKEIREDPGYGIMLIVESKDPETREPVDVVYSHLAEAPNFAVGQELNEGDIIATQGGTGNVESVDGTIASVDFLTPAPAGSNSMAPYANYESLGQRIVEKLTR